MFVDYLILSGMHRSDFGDDILLFGGVTYLFSSICYLSFRPDIYKSRNSLFNLIAKSTIVDLKCGFRKYRPTVAHVANFLVFSQKGR